MKKIFSVLLCIFLLSTIAVNVAADGETLSSVLFMSDYQFIKNKTPELFGDNSITSCMPVVDKLTKTAYNIGHNVETVVVGGDYTANDGARDKNDPQQAEIYGENLQYHYGNTPIYSINEIESVVKKYYAGTDFIHVQGNHDPDLSYHTGGRFSFTGAHEYDEYIIYVLNDEDFVGPSPRTYDVTAMSNIVPGSIIQIKNPDDKVKKTAEDMKAYFEKLEENGDMRPIFVCSHQPLHFTDNNYNGKAHYIYDAVESMSDKFDIFFFFGHTHDQTDEIGGGLAYVPVGGKINVCDDTLGEKGASYKNIGFTYLSYGNLGYYDGTNAVLTNTVADISKGSITFTKYGVESNVLGRYVVDRKNEAQEKNNTFVLTIDSKTADVFGTDVECDVAPIIRNDRTFTPARFVAENLGAEVEWNAEKQLVTITKGNTVIKMTIGMNTIVVNGKSESIDVAPFIENDRTFTPARVIAEKLGAEVEWNADLRQVIINQ